MKSKVYILKQINPINKINRVYCTEEDQKIHEGKFLNETRPCYSINLLVFLLLFLKLKMKTDGVLITLGLCPCSIL